jgi:hypothetical protein
MVDADVMEPVVPGNAFDRTGHEDVVDGAAQGLADASSTLERDGQRLEVASTRPLPPQQRRRRVMLVEGGAEKVGGLVARLRESLRMGERVKGPAGDFHRPPHRAGHALDDVPDHTGFGLLRVGQRPAHRGIEVDGGWLAVFGSVRRGVDVALGHPQQRGAVGHHMMDLRGQRRSSPSHSFHHHVLPKRAKCGRGDPGSTASPSQGRLGRCRRRARRCGERAKRDRSRGRRSSAVGPRVRRPDRRAGANAPPSQRRSPSACGTALRRAAPRRR